MIGSRETARRRECRAMVRRSLIAGAAGAVAMPALLAAGVHPVAAFAVIVAASAGTCLALMLSGRI